MENNGHISILADFFLTIIHTMKTKQTCKIGCYLPHPIHNCMGLGENWYVEVEKQMEEDGYIKTDLTTGLTS